MGTTPVEGKPKGEASLPRRNAAPWTTQRPQRRTESQWAGCSSLRGDTQW